MTTRLTKVARTGGRLHLAGAMLAAGLAVLLAGCGASLNSGAALPESGEPKLGAAPFESISPDSAQIPKAKTKAADTGSAGVASRSSVGKLAESVVATSQPGSTGYKIGPFDVLEVHVFKVPELSRLAQVSDNGTVSLALVGEYRVVGRTATDVERDLTKRLKEKYLQNPQVTVTVKEFNSQRITIEGAVKKTGVHPLRSRTTLLQAVAMADGLADNADTNIVVFRQSEQGRTGARFDLAEIRTGQADDPQLQSGDVIVVGQSFWKEQYNNFTKLLPLVGVFGLLL